MPKARIVPVILAGGAGTRLWPLSRELQPKQFHPILDTELSLFQQTILRVRNEQMFAPPVIVSNEAHRFVVGAQLQAIGVRPALQILEPMGRSTGPAIAAALLAADIAEDDLVLVLPTDHFVDGPEKFCADVKEAAKVAQSGAIVLFGLKPDRPETGYGYIKYGQCRSETQHVRDVIGFVEKPQAKAAKELMEADGWLWNLGIFLFRKDALLEGLTAHAGALLKAVSASVANGRRSNDQFWPDPIAFESAPSISIDYALIEKTKSSAVVPVTFGWSDLGSWREIWASRNAPKAQENGLVAIGDVSAIDVRNSYLRSDAGLLAAIGVEDLVVVSSGDAVLVAPMSRSQDVGKLVESLRRQRRRETRNHLLTYRPWGHFLTLAEGPGYQVKILTLDPGAAISLQYHDHRAERWIVVEGEAEITIGEERRRLKVHDSVEIPKRVTHQLSNPSSSTLKVIEVQSGPYLGEDDIVRLPPPLGRTDT